MTLLIITDDPTQGRTVAQETGFTLPCSHHAGAAPMWKDDPGQHMSGSGFYFFRTHAGAEIDLLVDRGQTRIGFEFKAGASTTPRDWLHLQAGIDDKVIDKGILVYNGARSFPVSDKIRVVPAAAILTTGAKW